MAQDPLHRAEKVKRDDESGFLKTGGNIAAIDFGTTFCTLAFTTRGDTEVNTLKLGGVHQRVPNAILLHKGDVKCRVVDFGYRAQETYAKMRPGDRVNHIYFERMKMILERDEDLSRETIVQSFTNESYYLVEVIAFVIKYLKDQLEEHLVRTINPLKAKDFDWVITVPAIWKARGKRMMREAAYMAGLLSPQGEISTFSTVGRGIPRPEEFNHDKLSLALEPEVAAIYSQQVTAKEVAASSSRRPKPKNYMVIDIGGGTVDITAQHDNAGKCDVVIPPMGNDWGGTKVNQQFAKFLSAVVGDEDFTNFTSIGDARKCITNRAAINKLIYNEFEQEKVKFGENVGNIRELKDAQGLDKETSITLPASFIDFYQEDRIRVGIAEYPGLNFDDDILYMTYRKMAELFEPTIEGIIECTMGALEQLQGQIETIYLVGGFGGCRYVHGKINDRLKERFPRRNYQVIVPTSPNLAIATGAVMWRKDPTVIQTRRSDGTYGIGMNIPFDTAKHDPFYKFAHPETGEPRCRSVLSVFVQVGETVKTSEVFKTYVIPHRQAHTSMSITIYCTKDRGVLYLKDKTDRFCVRKIGELIIDIPNPGNTPREDRKVYVIMDFSGTEIQAKARYSLTGKEVKIVCDFLTYLQ